MNAKTQEVSKAPAHVHGGTPSFETETNKSQAPAPRRGMENNRGYVRVSKGYPVQEGQTWHDLTQLQRGEWMRNHENRWKKKYNENKELQAAGGGMSWTRG